MNNPPLPSGLEGYQLVRLSHIIAGDIILDTDTGDRQPATQGECDARVFIGDDGRTASGHYVYRKYEPPQSVPDDFPAGWQNVRNGAVQIGDVVCYGDSKDYAVASIGSAIRPDGCTWSTLRVYRKIPVAKQGLSSDGAVLKNDQPVPDGWKINPAWKDAPYRDPIIEAGMKVFADGSAKPTNPKDAIGSGKLPLGLVPDTINAFMALAFLEGGLKYGSSNWRAMGVRSSVYHDACLRHIAKWWNGEWADQKTSVPHLASAAACIAIILDAGVMEKLTDDRPPKNLALVRMIDRMSEANVKHLKDLFKNENPKHWTIEDNLL